MNEKRIYIVSMDDIKDNECVEQLTDEQFIERAERRGTVYSLEGFEKAWNEGIYMEMPDYSYMRILEVKKFHCVCYTFNGIPYSCRVVKDKNGEDLIIGSTAFLDVLQPNSVTDTGEGFVSKLAEKIYDEIFYFTDEESLRLPDDKLIEVLKEDNPEWF